MLKLTRRGWIGATLSALAAVVVPQLPGRPALAALPPPPGQAPAPPRKRKRWLGHY